MAVTFGGPYRITVEDPSGRVIVGVASTLTLTESCPDYARIINGGIDELPDMALWTIEASGIGNTSYTRNEFLTTRNTLTTAGEWVCDWCGSAQPRRHHKCHQCGGYKSVLVEV